MDDIEAIWDKHTRYGVNMVRKNKRITRFLLMNKNSKKWFDKEKKTIFQDFVR